MVSKKELLERIECHEDRLCDLRYELSLLNKKVYELERAKLEKDIKKATAQTKRKPGRPRKDAGRVDFAKKK